MDEIEQLKQSMAALEGQRAMLGDAVVDAAVGSMREKLFALEQAAAQKTAPPAEDSARRRKVITVLFADITLPGSDQTAGAGGSGGEQDSAVLQPAQSDAEELSEWMDELWAEIDATIEAHDGQVDKHIGDTIMAMWGAETTREDDASRAIHAALAMQQALAGFCRQRSLTMLMRIGINTGPALLGSVGTTREFTALGDTVNLASRLEQAAPPGRILISHDTYRVVRGQFDLRAMEPLLVKGKSQPVQTYVIERERPRAFRLGSRGVEGIETRMIGRQADLQLLKDSLLAVFARREQRAFTVNGEAGIGKSRLLHEFTTWADLLPNPFYMFKGRASEESGKIPYALLRDLFAFRFQLRDSDPPEQAREKLENGLRAFLRDDPLLTEKVHFIGQLIGLDFSHSPYLAGILNDPKQIRDRAFFYLAQLFHAAARQPDVEGATLLLEDVHWADDGSLDALEYLFQECRAAPIFILGLARPALFERRPSWGQCCESHTRLELHPLTKEQSRELVGEILTKAAQVPQVLRELIVSGAEGNPFYVEELVKMLIDEKVILPGEEQWRIDASQLASLHVPSTLTGILQARLDGLPDSERMLLQKASVIGRVFWDSAVQALVDSDEPIEGEASNSLLVALRSKELIFQRDSSAFAGTREYIFKHTMLRDVTYESVLLRQRKTYHRQAAGWLIEHSGARAGEYAGIIAEHFERAGDSAQAAHWYGRAGQQAFETYAPEIAIGYFQIALQLQGQQPDPRPRVVIGWLNGLGDTLRTRVRFNEAEEAFQAMRETGEAYDDLLAQARALNGLAWLSELQGNHRTPLEVAARIEELVRQAENRPEIPLDLRQQLRNEQIGARYREGWAHYRLGNAARALQIGEQTLAAIDQGAPVSPQARAYILTLLGAVNQVLGNSAQSKHYKMLALNMHRERGDRQGEATMLNNLGETSRLGGDNAAAIRYYQEAQTITSQIGNQDLEVVIISNLGGALVGQGEYAAAETNLRQVIAMAERDWFVLSETYRFLAEACLGQDKAEEGLKAAREALLLGLETGDLEDIGRAWRVLGKCGLLCQPYHLELPNQVISDPRACFAESLRIFREKGMPAEQAYTLREQARYELERGDPARGHAIEQEAKALFKRLRLID